MSERRFALCALLLLSATGAGAQAAPSALRRVDLERRVDSLGAIAATARHRLVAFDDSVGALRRSLDSLTVPPFRMLVERELRPIAVAAAHVAAERLERLAGSTVASVGKHELVVRSERSRDDGPDPLVVAFLDTGGREVSQLWGIADTTTLASWMTQNGFRAINADMAPELHAWTSAPLSFDTLTATNWSFLRVGLTSSEATVARRCFEGNIAACRITLGIDTVANRAREWYDARGRRALVERQEWMLRRTDEAATVRCLDGDDEACVALLNKSEVMRLPGPARATLAQLAVQLGGTGAGERLFVTPGTPARRLEAAARMPVDSLIGEWHRRMRSARLASGDISTTIVGTSVLWLLVFGALSLRSSRWR